MLSSLRPRSIYDVCSAIACAGVLLGGTAYAAATITGADVVNSSLTGSDVKGSPATSTSVAVDGSLTGWDVKDGSLTGRDVAESTFDLRGRIVEVAPAVVGNADTDPCAPANPVTAQFCGSEQELTGTAWANYENGFQRTRFFKGADGIVHIEGHVRFGGKETIFILPVGYRPAAARLFQVYDEAGPGGYVKVHPDGRVIYRDASSEDSPYLQLDGISFRP